MPEQAKIPEYLGKCEVLHIHDDGDLTIKCRDKKYVVTTEGEVFKEVKTRPENWDEIRKELISVGSDVLFGRAEVPVVWRDNLVNFIEEVADEMIKGLDKC